MTLELGDAVICSERTNCAGANETSLPERLMYEERTWVGPTVAELLLSLGSLLWALCH